MVEVAQYKSVLSLGDSAPAFLTVIPESSQLFEYDNLSLSCGENSSILGWKVIRASGENLTVQSCEKWGTHTPFGCVLCAIKYEDRGIYWCESLAKERSNSVNITVHGMTVKNLFSISNNQNQKSWIRFS